MKKLVCLLLTLCLLCGSAFAQDTGIRPRGNNNAPGILIVAGAQLDCVYSAGGFGDIVIYNVEWMDSFISAKPDGSRHPDNFESGYDGEYLRISLRITNTTSYPIDYLPLIDNIICEYGSGYYTVEYEGWSRQRLIDALDNGMVYHDWNTSFPIYPYETGRYVICVTLPSNVVDTRVPLTVSFDLGPNMFSYYVR